MVLEPLSTLPIEQLAYQYGNRNYQRQSAILPPQAFLHISGSITIKADAKFVQVHRNDLCRGSFLRNRAVSRKHEQLAAPETLIGHPIAFVLAVSSLT